MFSYLAAVLTINDFHKDSMNFWERRGKSLLVVDRVRPDAPKIPRNEPKARPKVRATRPESTLLLEKLTKVKKRQKGGGWSLINRRSHTLCLSTACFLHVFPLVTFSLLLALSAKCPAASWLLKPPQVNLEFIHSLADNTSVCYWFLLPNFSLLFLLFPNQSFGPFTLQAFPGIPQTKR